MLINILKMKICSMELNYNSKSLTYLLHCGHIHVTENLHLQHLWVYNSGVLSIYSAVCHYCPCPEHFHYHTLNLAITSFLRSLTTAALPSVSTNLTTPGISAERNHTVLALLWLASCTQRSPVLWHLSVSSLLGLNNMQLYVFVTFYLFIHLTIDIWLFLIFG